MDGGRVGRHPTPRLCPVPTQASSRRSRNGRGNTVQCLRRPVAPSGPNSFQPDAQSACRVPDLRRSPHLRHRSPLGPRVGPSRTRGAAKTPGRTRSLRTADGFLPRPSTSWHPAVGRRRRGERPRRCRASRLAIPGRTALSARAAPSTTGSKLGPKRGRRSCGPRRWHDLSNRRRAWRPPSWSRGRTHR